MAHIIRQCRLGHSVASPSVLYRSFSTGFLLRNQAAAAAPEPAPGSKKAAIASSVPQGTVLKGINYMKEGKDPIALDDSEYPEWLWDLLDEKKQKQKSSKPSNRQYHRKQNRDAIRASNFMKDKKT
ncbi:mitochondrial ribosomal protein L37-domain-containing protein [Umbelopsis sp. AD052]|nr:mitochondrial ribosomal protein L37-domain-containing protein [Umbelopsis sp. AD052]